METSIKRTDLWNDVIAVVERSLNKQIVDSWFRPVQFEEHNADEKIVNLRAGEGTQDWVAL